MIHEDEKEKVKNVSFFFLLSLPLKSGQGDNITLMQSGRER